MLFWTVSEVSRMHELTAQGTKPIASADLPTFNLPIDQPPGALGIGVRCCYNHRLECSSGADPLRWPPQQWPHSCDFHICNWCGFQCANAKGLLRQIISWEDACDPAKPVMSTILQLLLDQQLLLQDKHQLAMTLFIREANILTCWRPRILGLFNFN